MDGDVEPGLGQPQANRPPDPSRAARDQGDASSRAS